MSKQHLFSNVDIFSVIQAQKERLKPHVEQIPNSKILNASEHDLVEVLVAEAWLDVPVLDEQGIYIERSGEKQIDVGGDFREMFHDTPGPAYVMGNEIVIAVPFQGDPDMFHIRPRRYTSSPPRAEVTNGRLLLTYQRTDHNAEAVKTEYQATVREIKEHLAWLSEAVDPYNAELESRSRDEILARKQKLLADANMVMAIGLPMKRREGVSVTYAVPFKKRVPRIEEIKVEGAFKPEPVLAMSEYEEILRIMKNMTQVIERSPHEFAGMGEETLRSHFLVQLNGAYEGQATGETFNFEGKTDILIRAEGRNVFIAECKFWSGGKAFLETIDQLLSYMSWRDTKAAVVVFNRSAGFTAVLDKIAEAVPKHAQFKRGQRKLDESTFRYVFGQPNDPNREITLTVMAFDVPRVADGKVKSANG
jgi:hypothetical protein